LIQENLLHHYLSSGSVLLDTRELATSLLELWFCAP
jgi:hypothetical protein